MKTLLIALTFLLVSTLAHAAPITYAFSGTASDVNTHQGGPFNGDYTFDSEAMGFINSNERATYFSQGSPYGLELSFLGLSFSSDSVIIMVTDRDGPPNGGLDRLHISGRRRVFAVELQFQSLYEHRFAARYRLFVIC